MSAAQSTPGAFEWLPIKRGDDIPDLAILAGSTPTDGEVYVGRNKHGVGKLNHSDGKMWNIWVSGGGSSQEGEILVVFTGSVHWVNVRKGDSLPSDAVLAGQTFTDGDVYPCRSKEGAVGKLNTDRGKVCSMWYHSHWTPKSEAEILCVAPPAGSGQEAAAQQEQQPSQAGYSSTAPATAGATPETGKDAQVPLPAETIPSMPQAAFGIVGSRVELSNKDCTATRVSGVNCAVCVGKEPLPSHANGYYFELRVDAKYRSPRALAVGVTAMLPTDMVNPSGSVRGEEARGTFERTWIVGYDHGGALLCSDGTESKIPDAAWRPVKDVEEGSLIGVLWVESSDPPELVILQDGVEKVRLPATGQLPRRGEELFAIVDLQGCVSQVSLFHDKASMVGR